VIASFWSDVGGPFVGFLILAFIALGIWAKTQEGKGRGPISKAGVRASGSGQLLCPNCGGSQFKAKRSAAGKVAAGLLAPKTRVKCETCGTEYLRG
jgi:hypothetical protein